MPRYHVINGEQVPFTAQEEAARDVEEDAWNAATSDRSFTALRKIRDSLLLQCDWMCLSDQTPSQEWLDYRQALRDLPANTVDPNNPDWPVKPS